MMKSIGIYHYGRGDHVTWAGKKKIKEIEVEDTYYNLCTKEMHLTKICLFYKFWCTIFPSNIIMFLWLTWKNKNLTWDNPQKRKRQGSGSAIFVGMKGKIIVLYLLVTYMAILFN